MMRKMAVLLMAIVLLVFAAGAMAEGASAEPVWLDSTTIIDDGLIYYSGSIDGGERGVFIMNADGSDPQKISGVTADLLALSGSNLLVYQYDIETGDAQMAVLKPDGTLIPLAGEYSGAATAEDGRFYWGPFSCAEDGSDVSVLFDYVNYYDYYTLDVADGYLYYLDWSEMSGTVFSEGSLQPMGAALCRLNLADGSIEEISGVGTRFLGVEDGLIYYTRDNFWRLTADSSEEIQVDEGLFCASADTLEEVRLAEYAAGDSVSDSYKLLKDGVAYGMHSDYSSYDETDFCIIRVQKDGTRLPDIPVESEAGIALVGVEDGVLYLAQCNILFSEDDFIQNDRIIAIRLEDGQETVIDSDSLDMLFYTEQDPFVKVVDGRIYFVPYDMERWSVCLKCMNIDGTDLQLLAHGISFAEG